jgi:hydrogenase-1 operon protein HyaF
MHSFPIPVVALGLGSQQEDESLEYMSMPKDMHTFRLPELPEPEEVRDRAGVLAWFDELLRLVQSWTPAGGTRTLDMRHLTAADRQLIGQVLGEGEVSAQVQGEDGNLIIQESVFAGVWRVRGRDKDDQDFADRIEVGDVPAAISICSGMSSVVTSILPGPNVVNAQALLAEIAEQVTAHSATSHVINLSLLPFSPEDGIWLDECLGRGSISILSRGYGNCRITATGVARVWWVQYFNSQDALILNTLEITDVPEVARAAAEDLEDSAERLAEVLAWIGD